MLVEAVVEALTVGEEAKLIGVPVVIQGVKRRDAKSEERWWKKTGEEETLINWKRRLREARKN